MADNQSSFEPQPGPSHQYDHEYEKSIAVDLLSKEKLDRSSPEIWPERVPRISEILDQFRTDHTYVACWEKELNDNDIKEMYKLSKLPVGAVIAEVKKLHNLAFQLGQEEAKEMTRGKYLEIFESKMKRKAHI